MHYRDLQVNACTCLLQQGQEVSQKHGIVQHDASWCACQVASFQCLQPFVGTLLAFAVLGEEPSAWDLGAVGVLVGLVLIVSDKHDLQASITLHATISPVGRVISHG